jgi:hypothetical protein
VKQRAVRCVHMAQANRAPRGGNKIRPLPVPRYPESTPGVLSSAPTHHVDGRPARILPTSARAKRTRSVSAPRAAASSLARSYAALRT